jgi:hypothetical protein
MQFHNRLDHTKNQLISGVPLSVIGTIFFGLFNWSWVMTAWCWLRASISDPGYLPNDL